LHNKLARGLKNANKPISINDVVPLLTGSKH